MQIKNIGVLMKDQNNSTTEIVKFILHTIYSYSIYTAVYYTLTTTMHSRCDSNLPSMPEGFFIHISVLSNEMTGF